MDAYILQILDLAQDCSNSTADALELPQSCIKPSTSPLHADPILPPPPAYTAMPNMGEGYIYPSPG